MPYRFSMIATGLLGATTLLACPAAAQELPEPTVPAQPIDVAKWQRHIASDLEGYARFSGLPAMRFGFMVGSDGAVRSCMALPVNGGDKARGQPLCEAFIEHAKFQPARDAEGNTMESVFVIQFGDTPPVVAADYAGVPVS